MEQSPGTDLVRWVPRSTEDQAWYLEWSVHQFELDGETPVWPCNADDAYVEVRSIKYVHYYTFIDWERAVLYGADQAYSDQRLIVVTNNWGRRVVMSGGKVEIP